MCCSSFTRKAGRIYLAGVTRYPDQEWMEQMARNVTMEESGILANCRYLLHDHDSKYCASFRELIEAEKVKAIALPPQSPNLNAYAERWVRSVKEECLSRLILFGERSLKRALHHYEMHYHQERNHQGKDNLLLFPSPLQPLRRKQGEAAMSRTFGRLAQVLRAQGRVKCRDEFFDHTLVFPRFMAMSC